MAKKQTNQRQKRPTLLGRVRRFIFRTIWRLTWFGSLTAAIFITIMWLMTPDVTDISPRDNSFGIRIYAGDGETLIGTFGELTAEPITAETIPENLKWAIIASEDQRFYWHPGLDPEGLARAMYVNIQRGRLSQGGSTLTQQFAKLRFLDSERTLWRKVQEAVIALKLEWHHSKNEILAAYMNEVYAGSGIYGMSGAAQRYFNVSVQDLSEYQAAVLAGIVQAPSRQNPARSEEEANRRARTVISAMERDKHITPEQADAYRAQSPNLLPPQVVDANNPAVGYFRDWINAELDGQVNEVITRYNLEPGQDINVYTTLDLNLQKEAARRVRDLILSRGLTANASQAGAVVMDQRGAVLAMVGGTDYVANQYNRAAEAERQPGSTFKLFVYLAALDRGQQRGSTIQDVAATYEGWTPSNYSGRSHGPVTLQEAFAKSYNQAAVNLSEAVGRDRVRRLAAELLNQNLSQIPEGPSVALGSGETTLLDLTAAYGLVSAGGNRLRPFGIEKIVLEDGTTVELATEPVSSSLSRSNRAVGDMTLMMRSVVQDGTGRRARIDDFTYGKTGTSSSFRDAWFVGFHNSPVGGNLIAGIWMGNDDNSAMDRVSGGSLPAELWQSVVSIGSPLAGRVAPPVLVTSDMPVFDADEGQAAQENDGEIIF